MISQSLAGYIPIRLSLKNKGVGTCEVWGILQQRGKCIRDGEISGLLPPGGKKRYLYFITCRTQRLMVEKRVYKMSEIYLF